MTLYISATFIWWTNQCRTQQKSETTQRMCADRGLRRNRSDPQTKKWWFLCPKMGKALIFLILTWADAIGTGRNSKMWPRSVERNKKWAEVVGPLRTPCFRHSCLCVKDKSICLILWAIYAATAIWASGDCLIFWRTLLASSSSCVRKVLTMAAKQRTRASQLRGGSDGWESAALRLTSEAVLQIALGDFPPDCGEVGHPAVASPHSAFLLLLLLASGCCSVSGGNALLGRLCLLSSASQSVSQWVAQATLVWFD